MFRDLKDAAHRSADTLVEDMLGCAALVVMLVAGLTLPALF